MTTVTHTFVGIATGTVVHGLGLAPTGSRINMILIGVLLANLPDINVLWHKRNLHSHHRDFTHYPIFWLATTAAVFVLEFFILNPRGYFLSTFMGISVLAHLFLDTIGNTIGIHWFYPLSEKEFSFTRLKKEFVGSSIKEMLSRKYHGNHLWVELLICTMSLLVILLGF